MRSLRKLAGSACQRFIIAWRTFRTTRFETRFPPKISLSLSPRWKLFPRKLQNVHARFIPAMSYDGKPSKCPFFFITAFLRSSFPHVSHPRGRIITLERAFGISHVARATSRSNARSGRIPLSKRSCYGAATCYLLWKWYGDKARAGSRGWKMRADNRERTVGQKTQRCNACWKIASLSGWAEESVSGTESARVLLFFAKIFFRSRCFSAILNFLEERGGEIVASGRGRIYQS